MYDYYGEQNLIYKKKKKYPVICIFKEVCLGSKETIPTVASRGQYWRAHLAELREGLIDSSLFIILIIDTHIFNGTKVFYLYGQFLPRIFTEAPQSLISMTTQTKGHGSLNQFTTDTFVSCKLFFFDAQAFPTFRCVWSHLSRSWLSRRGQGGATCGPSLAVSSSPFPSVSPSSTALPVWRGWRGPPCRWVVATKKLTWRVYVDEADRFGTAEFKTCSLPASTRCHDN